MRKRWRKSWLWTLLVSGVWLPYAAHSRPAKPPASASAAPLALVEAQGAASLHQAAGTAWQAALAVEAAQGIVRQVTHSLDPKDALSDCQGRWGQDLGPVLCPAMFRDGPEGRSASHDVEGRLLQALWHVAGRQAGLWWHSGQAMVASCFSQLHALHATDDGP